MDPAVLESVVDDGVLDVLDGHCRTVDAQHAGSLRHGVHNNNEGTQDNIVCTIIMKAHKTI